MPTFLMKCPSCGKHFEVERTGEEVEKKDEVELVDERQGQERNLIGQVYVPSVVDDVVESDNDEVPVAVEKKIFTKDYKCKHCGYTWSEKKVKVKREDG